MVEGDGTIPPTSTGSQVPPLPAAHRHLHQHGFDHADICRTGPLRLGLRPLRGPPPQGAWRSAAWPEAVALARKARSTVVTYAVDPRHPAEAGASSATADGCGSSWSSTAPGAIIAVRDCTTWRTRSGVGPPSRRWVGVGLSPSCRTFRCPPPPEVRRSTASPVVDDRSPSDRGAGDDQTLRGRWPDRRLWAVFDPGATPAARLHQAAYAEAFDAPPGSVSEAGGTTRFRTARLDIDRLVADLVSRGLLPTPWRTSPASSAGWPPRRDCDVILDEQRQLRRFPCRVLAGLQRDAMRHAAVVLALALAARSPPADRHRHCRA